MGRFDGQRIGLREKDTNKLITAYPYNVTGTDVEIIKRVKDWFYQTSCSAEDVLLRSYVDFLDDEEMKQYSM